MTRYIAILFSLCLSSLVLQGCSMSMPEWSDFWDDNIVEKLWTQRKEYVYIEKQDLVNGKKPRPNQHPVKIARQHIRDALALVYVQEGPKEDKVPLFDEYHQAILGRYFEEGLAQAKPDEDLTFVVSIWYKGMMGIRQAQVSTGRVFYDGKNLNMIFGEILRGAQMFEDEALESGKDADIKRYPFIPGLRGLKINPKVILSTVDKSAVFNKKGRSEWLLFSKKALLSGPIRSAKKSGSGAGGASEDYDDLRKEIEALKRQVRKGRGRESSPSDDRRARSPSPTTSAQETEEKLTILENLRKRGLISEQEYREKRQYVLDGF